MAAAAVILATYRQPAWLEKALWGYAVQTRRDFELLVADDGSGPETAEAIARVREASGLPIRHVWHEDRGHRKTVILNRAVLAARADYLIFSDGDCIPRADFVETHLRLARPGRFLSGGALRLPLPLSRAITADDVREGRATDLRWLRARGWRPGRRALRLLGGPRLGRALDLVTPTRATWNGGNASTWRAAVEAANGFEAEMGYGGQDREFGERLEHRGLRGLQVRHRALCVHLEHERPYRTEEAMRRSRAARSRTRRSGAVRARHGLAELAAELAAAGEPPDRAPPSGRSRRREADACASR